MHPIGVLATDYNGRGGVLRSGGDQVFSMLLRRLLRACIFMHKGVLCEDDMIWWGTPRTPRHEGFSWTQKTGSKFVRPKMLCSMSKRLRTICVRR